MKKRFCVSLMLIMAAFGFFATIPAEASASKYRLINEGSGVGILKIGQPVSKYEKFLGASKVINQNFFDYPSKRIALLVKDGIISGIMVYSPVYYTKKGVKVGQPVSSLNKAYGTYFKTDSGSLTYSDLGLAFNAKNGIITRIMVVPATPDPLLGDKLIVPGVRIGNIQIGMDIGTVLKYWGEPDKRDQLEENKKISVYVYSKKAVTLLVSDEIVQGVRINSFKYKTPEGIGIDSTEDQVTNTYGKRFNKVKESIMYDSLGIGFFFNKGKVLEVLLTYRKN